MTPKTILSIHYLPCISWFRHLLYDESVVLDQHEYYVKQSYRNRCMILSANGPLSLTVPVKKTKHKMHMYEVEIENDFGWQKQHWEAIRSAYNSSPYFEHFEHHFEKYYSTEFKFLSEFNLGLITVCLKIMKTETELKISDQYIIADSHISDFRELIHPKKQTEETFKSYLQVFTSEFPFVPNLSMIDLVFNYGRDYIKFI